MTVKEELQGTLRWLVRSTVVLYVVIGGFGLYVWMQTHETRSSLCSLRIDLEGRVVRSEAFLEKHPKGIPGISPQEIRDGIKNQRRTIDALSGLGSCD